MNEVLTWVVAWLAGGLLGAIYFGGLWWTVCKGVSSFRPVLWFLGSLLLRMSFTVAGFYFVCGGQWKRLVACLVGFIATRLVVTWLTRPSGKSPNRRIREASHAP